MVKEQFLDNALRNHPNNRPLLTLPLVRLFKGLFNSKLAGLLFISTVWFVIGWSVRGLWSVTDQLPPEAQRILRAGQIILTQHFPGEVITPETVAIAAIRGMLRVTGDRYAGLFVGEVSKRFQSDFAGETGAPGLWYTIDEGKIIITELRPKGPAEAAGIQVGDQILGADDVRFDEFTTGEEAAMLIRGPVGVPVTLTIQRDEQILTFALQRIIREEMTADLLHGQIGYIKLPSFPSGIEAQLQDTLRALQRQGMDALVWDLRGNAGGSMRDAEAILNAFIAQGTLYTAVLKNGEQLTFTAKNKAFLANLPLVVLTDSGTYSASEMVTAALRDHQRAIVVGTRTGGKGVIQDTIRLDDQALLHLTIAKWLSPAGYWIHKQGIAPDVTLVDDPTTAADEVLDFAVAQLRL